MFRSTFNGSGLRSDCSRGGCVLGIEFGRRGVDHLLSAARSRRGLIVARETSTSRCGSRAGARMLSVRMRGHGGLRGAAMLLALATVAFLPLQQTQYLCVQHAACKRQAYLCRDKKDYLVMFTELNVSLKCFLFFCTSASKRTFEN